MISSTLAVVSLVLGLVGDDPAAPIPPALGAYKSAAAQAGRDSEAHVRLALWCEAHGLTAERLKHLSLAVLYQPTNALARGLMGLVAYRGKWERPDEVSAAVRNDPQRVARNRDYLERRARTADRAGDQWKLALWCEQSDLKPQATAHLIRVIQLDPAHDAAWKHLGYKRIGGRWDKPERVAAARAEAQAQHTADKHWKPALDSLASGLASKDKTRRTQAEKSLVDVNDPRAVPMIWVVFVSGDTSHQKVAVRLLAQIDAPGSSRALALLAFQTRSADVKSEATKVLGNRDPRDFASVLIALLRDPIQYEVRPVNGPGTQGQLVIKQKDKNVKRLYSPPSAPHIPILPNDRIVADANGLPVLVRELGYYQTPPIPIGNDSPGAVAAMLGLPVTSPVVSSTGVLPNASALFGLPGLSPSISQNLAAALARGSNSTPVDLPRTGGLTLEAIETVKREVDIPIGQMLLDARQAAQVAEQQLATDVQAIEDYNLPIAETNDRARQVLRDSIGIDQGPDLVAWEKWLVDLSGYSYSAPRSYDTPTLVEQVPIAYQPQAIPVIVDQPVNILIQRHSCFAAGTMVRTIDGSPPIENIRAGDLVLTQNSKSGELSFQPVVTAYHNPPNATLRIDLGTETIVATGIHRFWKAGQGWVMARELKTGDTLRTMGGIAVVRSVESERVQPVFNLQVAEGESFFVGGSGVLAHDNSVVSPTSSPFDAVPELEKSLLP